MRVEWEMVVRMIFMFFISKNKVFLEFIVNICLFFCIYNYVLWLYKRVGKWDFTLLGK